MLQYSNKYRYDSNQSNFLIPGAQVVLWPSNKPEHT
jgi:hypothetical protein